MSPVVFFSKKRERGKFEIGIPVESPNSTESELELQLQFQVWNWNGGSIQFQNSPMELELELTELFQTLISQWTILESDTMFQGMPRTLREKFCI